MQLFLAHSVLCALAPLAAGEPTALSVEDVDVGGPIRVRYGPPVPEGEQPVVLEEVVIPEDEVKRFLIYGTYRPALEWRRIHALIEDEIRLREDEGKDVSHLSVSDEVFQAHYDKKIGEFVEKYPMLDVETEISRAYRSLSWYRRELRQEMLFDADFVPDDQAQWPDLTFEALRQEAGEILIDDFRKSFERRNSFLEEQRAEWLAKGDTDEDPGPEPVLQPEDSMYRSILRQIVRDNLYKVVDTQTALTGLSKDRIATMDFDWDGEPELTLSTEEAWSDVTGIVTQQDVDEARLFLALIEAARQRLAYEGKLLSNEEIATELEEITSKFQSGMFDLGQIAIGGHQFPSVEAYGDYFGLHESYKRSIDEETAVPLGSQVPDVLRAHLHRANHIMGLAKVDAEVLLVAAFDFENFEWIEGGWDKARDKAERLMAEMQRNERSFEESQGKDVPDDGAASLDPVTFWQLLIDDHCDFWDPPPPQHGRQSTVGYKQKGRFGDRTRNDLRSLMSESAYHHFLRGELLTDRIFFDQSVGVVDGPHKGSFGYYVTKVLRRGAPSRPLNTNDRRHIDLLRDDYARVSFITYAHDALDDSEVGGR